MIVPGEPGVYVVGTGDAGVAKTFFVLGAGYFVVMLARGVLVPAAGAGLDAGRLDAAIGGGDRRKMMSTHHVAHRRGDEDAAVLPALDRALLQRDGRHRRARGGQGHDAGPVRRGPADGRDRHVRHHVRADDQRRSTWSAGSSGPARRTTSAGSGPTRSSSCWGSRCTCRSRSSPRPASRRPALGWLVLFYAVTMVIFTMYGGGFATIPAYLADLFGTRFVGGIHGRLLTAWSTAGVLGPLAITQLREIVAARAHRGPGGPGRPGGVRGEVRGRCGSARRAGRGQDGDDRRS